MFRPLVDISAIDILAIDLPRTIKKFGQTPDRRLIYG